VDFETIVVDNASTDGTPQEVQKEFTQVKLISNLRNVGFAAANNQGLKIARGRFFLLLNPDTEVDESTITNALSYAEAHPEVGILGGRSFQGDGSQQSTIFRYPRIAHLVANILFPSKLIRRSVFLGGSRYVGYDLNSEHDVEVVAGCFMFLRREVYDSIGGMDESFFMYGEEVEWCYRASSSGWVIRYIPDVTITHYGGISTGQFTDSMNLEIAKSRLVLLQKIRGRRAAITASLLMLARECVRFFACAVFKSVPFLRQYAADKQIRQYVNRMRLYLYGLRKGDWLC